MKVKYLLNTEHLKAESIYNVFSVYFWKKGEKKYYIANYDTSGKYYITPFDGNEFEIVDTSISKFWNYGLDNYWEECLWIKEIITEEYFWDKYYNDDLHIKKILDLYYKIWKEELFNFE